MFEKFRSNWGPTVTNTFLGALLLFDAGCAMFKDTKTLQPGFEPGAFNCSHRSEQLASKARLEVKKLAQQQIPVDFRSAEEASKIILALMALGETPAEHNQVAQEFVGAARLGMLQYLILHDQHPFLLAWLNPAGGAEESPSAKSRAAIQTIENAWRCGTSEQVALKAAWGLAAEFKATFSRETIRDTAEAFAGRGAFAAFGKDPTAMEFAVMEFMAQVGGEKLPALMAWGLHPHMMAVLKDSQLPGAAQARGFIDQAFLFGASQQGVGLAKYLQEFTSMVGAAPASPIITALKAEGSSWVYAHDPRAMALMAEGFMTAVFEQTQNDPRRRVEVLDYLARRGVLNLVGKALSQNKESESAQRALGVVNLSLHRMGPNNEASLAAEAITKAYADHIPASGELAFENTGPAAKVRNAFSLGPDSPLHGFSEAEVQRAALIFLAMLPDGALEYLVYHGVHVELLNALINIPENASWVERSNTQDTIERLKTAEKSLRSRDIGVV